MYWRLARCQATWLLDPLCRLSWAMVARAARGDPQRFTQQLARRQPDADRRTTRRVLARPGAEPVPIEDLQESYRQGTTVIAADLLRYGRPWGFGLAEVTTTVHLWHSEQDPKVSITTARQLAARLPDCQAHSGPGGHLMACDHAGEILERRSSSGVGFAEFPLTPIRSAPAAGHRMLQRSARISAEYRVSCSRCVDRPQSRSAIGVRACLDGERYVPDRQGTPPIQFGEEGLVTRGRS